MEKGTQLSEKVTQILLHEIRNGDFNGLDSLPPEVELAEKFNVSRNVIRESLARLEREGWVVRKHGIGTLINKSVVHVDTRLDLNFELNQTLELSGKHAKQSGCAPDRSGQCHRGGAAEYPCRGAGAACGAYDQCRWPSCDFLCGLPAHAADRK